MNGMAIVVLLVMTLSLALLSSAGAVLALGGGFPEQEDVSCHSNLLFRLISMSDFASEVDVATAWALEGTAARNCSHTFVRGVHGMDLGLGPQLYGSDHNFKTAQVIDFESEGDVDAYLLCLEQQHSTALVARLGRKTAQVKAVIPASACPQDALGSSSSSTSRVSGSNSAAVLDVYALHGLLAAGSPAAIRASNAATTVSKQRQPAADATTMSKQLLSLIRAAADKMVYALGGSTWSYYDFTSRAAQTSEYAAVAGTMQLASASLLRAYWAYLHGPPVVPHLAAASAAVTAVARIQMHPVQLKPATGAMDSCTLLLGQDMSCLPGGAALHRRQAHATWAPSSAS